MDALDKVGQIIWFGGFVAPFLSVLLFWRVKSINRVSKILIGLLVGIFVGLVMLGIGLSICFRNGMGPS